MPNISRFIEKLPKVELHMHLEGSLEPELMMALALRNKMKFPFQDIAQLRDIYKFHGCKEFLDIYYRAVSVLVTEQDFYDLTWAYLEKAHIQNIVHVELFFDPQAHTQRGVFFDTVVNGINRALLDGEEKLGITSQLIMCFARHLSEDDAFRTLEFATPHNDKIFGVGLDSLEPGNPPSKFERVFTRARKNGFKYAVAHAGEEGPAEYIAEALDCLKAYRIDHGNNSMGDLNLMNRLVDGRIPLTMCPVSNLKLSIIKKLEEHPIKKMLDAGILVSVNSDNPSYFGAYLNENFYEITRALNLSRGDLIMLVENSIESSFASELRKSDIRRLLGKTICENDNEVA